MSIQGTVNEDCEITQPTTPSLYQRRLCEPDSDDWVVVLSLWFAEFRKEAHPAM